MRGIGSTIPSPGIPLANETVEIYADNGLFIGTATTNAAGVYTVQTGLPAGRYFVKTSNAAGFVDQVFNGKTCVDCPVQSRAIPSRSPSAPSHRTSTSRSSVAAESAEQSSTRPADCRLPTLR